MMLRIGVIQSGYYISNYRGSDASDQETTACVNYISSTNLTARQYDYKILTKLIKVSKEKS